MSLHLTHKQQVDRIPNAVKNISLNASRYSSIPLQQLQQLFTIPACYHIIDQQGNDSVRGIFITCYVINGHEYLCLGLL